MHSLQSPPLGGDDGHLPLNGLLAGHPPGYGVGVEGLPVGGVVLLPVLLDHAALLQVHAGHQVLEVGVLLVGADVHVVQWYDPLSLDVFLDHLVSISYS